MLRWIALTALLLTACKDDGDRQAALRETLDLNIKKTRAFFVDYAKLVAVQDDGTLVEVQVTTGGEGSWAEPRGIVDTPSHLFFMYRGVQYKGKQCSLIPVRKSDGAMFCVDIELLCISHGNCNSTMSSMLKSTADGQFIYLISDGTLSRIELKGIDNSRLIEISSWESGGMVDKMVINSSGDLLTTVAGDVRYYRASGGFVNLLRGSSNGPCIMTGPGHGDDFYWAVRDGGQPLASVNKVYRTGDEVTAATIASQTGDGWGIQGCMTAATTDATYLGGNAYLTEVLNAAGTPRYIALPELDRVRALAGCPDHLIIAGFDKTGNEVVERYFPGVPTTQTLASTKDYIMTTFSVDSACRITFSGRRSSDNARLVGQIEPGSDTVKVIAEDLSADVTQILAIH